MARVRLSEESVQLKLEIAERLRELRIEFHGSRGSSKMARRLGVPVPTWRNYESGVTVPAEVILRLIEALSVEPRWLLRGMGPKFRTSVPEAARDPVGSLVFMALEKLRAERERRGGAG